MFDTDWEEMKESKPLEKIQLKHLIIAFFILGVGCCAATIVFIFEKIFGGKVQNLQQSNDSENTNMESILAD